MKNIYPSDWRFTPVKGKAPDQKNWQLNPMTFQEVNKWVGTPCSYKLKDEFKVEHDVNGTYGLGLLLGSKSNGVCAIDFDGQFAFDYYLEHFGDNLADIDTVTWQGKEGRFQMAFNISFEYWNLLKPKKVSHNGEAIEFRWEGNQSVLPPSDYPNLKDKSMKYEWLRSPEDVEVAPIPENILNHWLDMCKPKPITAPATTNTNSNIQMYIKALELIKSYEPDLHYNDWIVIFWAFQTHAGTSTAISEMNRLWPETGNGYYQIANYHKPGLVTGGTLLHRARIYDKNFMVSKPKTAIQKIRQLTFKRKNK